MVDLRKTLFVVSMVIVVIAVVGFWFSRLPTGQVKFSLNRSVIKQDENATITVIVENVYRKEYIVEYRFEVSHRVTIYEGAERPLPLIGSQYTFNYVLNATVPSDTRRFDVIGTLEDIYVSSATYPISLTVFFDGQEQKKTWSDLTLTVEQ